MRKFGRELTLHKGVVSIAAAAAVVGCGGGGTTDELGAGGRVQALAAGRPQTVR